MKRFAIIYMLFIYSRASSTQQAAAQQSIKADTTHTTEEVVGEPGNAASDTTKIYYTTRVNNEWVDAKFENGPDEWQKYIADNLKVPDGKVLNGRVIMEFDIEKDGSLTNIRTLRLPKGQLYSGSNKTVKKIAQMATGNAGGIKVKQLLRAQYLVIVPWMSNDWI